MSDPGVIDATDQTESVTVSANRGTINPKRNIGGIVADITIEEEGTNELAITQHPVEKSADITDHAYPLPARLSIRVAWSPSGSASVGMDNLSGGDPVSLNDIYQKLLALQVARTLIEVQTGKLLYENMLIRTITLVTNVDTENALFISMQLQEILLAETQTVSVPSNNVQKDPQNTANTSDAGTKNAAPNPPNYNAGGN